MHNIIKNIQKLEWKLLRRLKAVWERINGLDFSENHSLKELGFTVDKANIYSATPDVDLENVLTQLNIKTTDSILDYGAGKGAALATMSKYKFNHVDGLELSKPLCEIARENFRKLGKKILDYLILTLKISSFLIFILIFIFIFLTLSPEMSWK